jgi:hypothetical protein
LIAAPPDTAVHIAEGEKDAETLAALGMVATTNAEGAKKGSWAPELNQWFVGRKRVLIPEDNDDSGRKLSRHVSPRRFLRGSHPAQRQTERPAGRASDQIRPRHQMPSRCAARPALLRSSK